MSDRYARCLNFDYCTLGDRRLVLRLAPGEPFFCPECAQALASARAWRSGGNRTSWPAIGATAMGAAAIAACVLVVQHWPQQMAAFVPHWLAPVRPAAPPSYVDIIRGTAPPDGMPDPGKLFLAATMDESMPPGAGSYILREHHRRPPRSDPAAVEAMAQLAAGVRGLPVPERVTRATMPWRQAMIMAALLAPGESLGPAGVPQLPIDTPASPAPASAPVQAPASAPPPQTQPAPHPASAPAGSSAMRSLDRRVERNLIWRAFERGAPPVVQSASFSMTADDAPTPVAGQPQKPAPRTAHKQTATKAAHPVRLAAETAAKKPAIAPAHRQPPITVVDVPSDDPPPPAKRVIVVPGGVSVSFGPINQGALNTQPMNPVYIPLRPSAAKPEKATMTVNCVIETSGVPSHCRVVSSTNAGALSDAMVEWLSSGMVRRQPKTEDGRLVRSRQVIVLEFPAQSQAPEPLK